MIDSHCHLTDERIWDLARSWIKAAQIAGIKHVRIGGLEPSEWNRQIELQNEFPNFIRTSFGLHPWWIEKYSRPQIDGILKELEFRLDDANAIGETGLDFYKKRDETRFKDQEHAFRIQIKLALAAKLPLVLHIVKAHQQALQILKEEKALDLPVQVHSFSGSKDAAIEWIKIGAFLSFSGAFTEPKNKKLREILKATPSSQILFETDSPDQAWREDKRNEPQFVVELYERGAQVLDLKLTSLVEIVAENFERFR